MTNINKRIARSLVTVIVLTLFNVIAAPIVAPRQVAPPASATNSSIIQTDLLFNANATYLGSDFGLNNMTLVGAPTQTVTRPGYYTFDADTKYAYSNIDYTDGHAASIFMWVYPTAAGVVLNLNATSSRDSGYSSSIIDYTGTKFRFGLWASGVGVVYSEASVASPVNNWYFIGLTYDGNTLTSYVNGVATGTANVGTWRTAGQTPGSNYFHIAAWQNGAYIGSGTQSGTAVKTGGRFRMGEIMFYSSAQSSADVSYNFKATVGRFGPISSNPTDATGLVNRSATFTTTACSGATSGSSTCNYQWQLSTDGGTNWNFIPGATTNNYTTPLLTSSYNGYKYRLYVWDPGTGTTTAEDLYTITSVATLIVTTPPGSDTDTSLSLATGKYAWAPDSNEFDITNAITIEAWVYQTDSYGTGWNMVLNKETSYELGTIEGRWYFGLRSASWSGVDTGVPTRYNIWQHVALTRATGSPIANLYIDGQLRWSGTADGAGSSALANSDLPFTIGGRSIDGVSFSSYFAGQIDEVRVFNSARTDTEIQSDMNTYGPINSTNLAVYYDFNETTGTKLYNRVSGATSASDLTIVGSPGWDSAKVESTTVSDVYTIKKFLRSYLTSNNGWKVPAGTPAISAIVVGGGGGGGYNSGGGGSGGGLLYSPRSSISGTLIVTVGAGGEGASTGGAIPVAGFASTLGSLTAAGGNPGGNYPASQIGGTGVVTVTGTSGAGGRGAPNDSTSGSAGSAGIQSSITGTSTNYGGGGGGGGWNANTGGGAGGAGGGGAGGITNSRNGKNGATNTGGGGGAGSASGYSGGDGGSGIIIIRWITAAKPTYTKPVTAYLNAGMTETFTTNVAQDSATAVLTRTFKWESTTPTANGAYTLIKQGTGAANAVFSWIPSDTSTSGSDYLYRLTVTDSDTAGLFISDSSTAYAVINRALVVSGSSSLGKTINLAKSETYAITLGTPTYTASLSPTIAGITLDTSTAGFAVIKISETMTVGTYYETLTVTDSVSASVVTPLTIVVAAPPNLVNTGEIVNNGLIFNLDFANSASFDRGTRAAKDISGSNKSVTVHNSPSFKDENLGHLDLNSSSSQYISATGFTTLTTWTIDTYFRLDSTSQHSCIVSSEGTSSTATRNLALCVDGTNPRIYAGFYDGVNWTYIRTNETIPLNSWTHVAAEWDGLTSNATTSVKIWINGTQATNYQWYTRGTSAAAASSNRIFINHDPVTTVSSYTDLSIGFVRIYNRALSFAEVTQNYNATKNRFLTANADLAAPSHKYGNTSTETYTITSGYGSDTISYATGNKSGVKLETTTSLVTLKMQESLTATTHYETITVTDSLGASTYLPITMSVTKADTITVTMGTAHTAVYSGTAPAGAPRASISGLVGVDTATVETQYSGTYIDSSLTCAQGGSCSVGDVGPGGGHIFYISSTPINAASGVSNGGIYLEAAPRNWNGDGSGEAGSSFASVLTNVNGTSSAIGTGAENSRILRQELGDSATAATKALNRSFNGVDDWFVPSYDELTRMITVLKPLGLGSFDNPVNLWSSTQNTNTSKGNNAWSSNPPVLNELLKTDNYFLRPIRAFSPTYNSTVTPTEVDTYTAKGTNLTFQVGALSNYQAVIYDTSTLKITQANQNKLTLNLYGAVAGTSFTLQIGGGSGTGAVTETITAGSTAINCRVSNKVLSNDTPATEQKTCNISITKASSRNYKAETLTATVYFMMFVNNQPTNQVGGGTVIALNGVTSFETSTVTPPGITGFSSLNISLSAGGNLIITGSGLTGSITVKFSRNKTISATAADGTYIEIPVASIQSAGATSGRVAVITANGEAVSDQSLTITP